MKFFKKIEINFSEMIENSSPRITVSITKEETLKLIFAAKFIFNIADFIIVILE